MTAGASRRRIRFVLAVIAAGILLGLFFGPLRGSLGIMQRPFVQGGTWIYAHTFGFFDPSAVGAKRVVELEAERAALAVDSATLERLRAENEDLRARLHFVARVEWETISADVMSRSVGPQMNRFSLDRGARDGIAVGMPVMVGEGILAGKIVEVSDTSATVAATTDRGVATAASLLGGARTVGVARGLDGTLLSLAFIPKDERVMVNDLVITSGLEDRVPSGLVLGMVNAVTSKDAEPFKTAIVEPLVDVRRISSVTVIIGHQAVHP